MIITPEFNLDRLQKHLIKEEGFKTIPYRCSEGKLTVGIGHNLEEPMSKKAIYFLLKDDIDRVVKDLDYHLGWWRGLTSKRQEALISMCFQIGITGLKKFKKMLKSLEEENWQQAYLEALDSKWYKQTQSRAKRVATMFLTREQDIIWHGESS